jgi:hypothetical protein
VQQLKLSKTTVDLSNSVVLLKPVIWLVAGFSFVSLYVLTAVKFILPAATKRKNCAYTVV